MALMDREVALAHYMQREFGLVWDYTVPPAHRISVAYTTVTDDERDAQVEVDIYDMKVYYYLDGELVLEEQWSEKEWIENFEWDQIFNVLIGEIEKYAE